MQQATYLMCVLRTASPGTVAGLACVRLAFVVGVHRINCLKKKFAVKAELKLHSAFGSESFVKVGPHLQK